MSRLQIVILLYAFFVVGVVLVAFPWTPLWERSLSFFLPTALAPFARSGWVRGAVSGIGLVDLLAASQEAGALLRSLSAQARGTVKP